MAVKRKGINAAMHKYGELWVIPPVDAQQGDWITWRASSDLVLLFPEEPNAGVFLDSDGQPVDRLEIKADTEGSVQIVAKRPKGRKSPSGRRMSVHGSNLQEEKKKGKVEEFPYAIYCKDWKDPHSAFFTGGSHPRIFIMWPD